MRRIIYLAWVMVLTAAVCTACAGGTPLSSIPTVTPTVAEENSPTPTPSESTDSEQQPTIPIIEATEDNAELSEGDTAPDFSVPLLTGETFTLSDHKGKVVFLNFWATWCPPCVAEMPAIQELSETYAEEAIFIGVDVNESEKKVNDFIEINGYTYHIGLGEGLSITEDLYPTLGIPYTVIIDAEGIIKKIFLGGGDQMHDLFDEAIRQALDAG